MYNVTFFIVVYSSDIFTHKNASSLLELAFLRLIINLFLGLLSLL